MSDKCFTPDGLEVFNTVDLFGNCALKVLAHEHNKKVSELEQQVLELKEDNARHLRLIDLDTKKLIEWGDKAGAWDDLEELINECRNENLIIAIKPNNSKQFFIVDSLENGGVFDCYIGFGMASVSNALECVKEKG